MIAFFGWKDKELQSQVEGQGHGKREVKLLNERIKEVLKMRKWSNLADI